MRIRSIKRYPAVVCLLLTATCTNQSLADWSVDNSRRGYNQGYGDFPPADINEQLYSHLKTENQAEKRSSRDNAVGPAISNRMQTDMPLTQNYPAYNYQQPSYGGYDRGGRKLQKSRPGNYPDMNFSGPWSGNGTGFSAPWNNNGSTFSMPWSNNSGSGFKPMGNGSKWGW